MYYIEVYDSKPNRDVFIGYFTNTYIVQGEYYVAFIDNLDGTMNLYESKHFVRKPKCYKTLKGCENMIEKLKTYNNDYVFKAFKKES